MRSLVFGLVVLIVGVVGFPVIGVLFTAAVNRWLPPRVGEVRPNTSFLGCGVLGVVVGLLFGGLAASSLSVNPTAPISVLLGLAFLLFGVPMVWWWSVWRLRIAGDQLHFQPGFGRSRTVAWSDLRVVEGRYWRSQVVLRFGAARPITVSAQSEGLGLLLEGAWKRSVPLKGFERFLKAGTMAFPAEI